MPFFLNAVIMKLVRDLLVIFAVALISDTRFGYGQLVKSNDCTCQDSVVTYKCNVTGSGFTLWRGSAFDCPTMDSLIILRHSSFGTSSGTMGLCNGGAIMGHSLGISTDGMGNSVYMSQLMVNLTASVIDQSVECVYRNAVGMDTLIASTNIQLEDPLPPPTNVRLVDISPEQLSFNWTSVDSNCSTLHYNIESTCGICPRVIGRTINSATCSIDASAVTESDMMLCTFAVLTVVCPSISGNLSIPVDITLKVPGSPQILSVIPRYYQRDNKIKGVNITFRKVEAFMISNGVDGSAHLYTTSYIDSNTGETCESLTVRATSCGEMNSTCTIPSITPLPCSERVGDRNIEVAISATNRLGSGPSSITRINQTNRFVNITFESPNKLLCTFLSQQESQKTLSCDVAYGPVCDQHPTERVQGICSSPTTVVIDLPHIPQTLMNEYCYVVNASNGIFVVQIEGFMLLGVPGGESQSDNSGLIAGVVLLTIIILLVFAVLALLLGWKVKSKLIWSVRSLRGANEFAFTELLPSDDADDAHVDAEPQSTPVHISFDLEDKPKELLRALKQLDSLRKSKIYINFKNVKIGPGKEHCVAVRKIYIECERDLEEEEKKAVEKLQIGRANTLKVVCKAETQEYTKDQMGMTPKPITVYLKDKPSALLSLLELIYSVKECKHINITDIDIKRAENGGKGQARVIVKFLPHMPEDWKEMFDKNQYKCKFVVKQPQANTSQD